MNTIQHSKKYFLIILGVMVVVLIVSMIFLFSTTSITTTPSPYPTPFQTEIPYSPEALDKDFERITKRAPLSPSDSQIRTKLISSAAKNGLIYTSAEFKVQYIAGPNQFNVELLAEDGEKTKQSAINWFKTQGLTTEGICNLPVVLYLNYQIAQNYSSAGKQFDPTIEGCTP